MLDLPKFISDHITGRPESLFKADFEQFKSQLAANIEGKSVLVIGGAGTIGAGFIKSILQFKPARLYVIDPNENGLTELVRDVRSSLGIPIPAVFLTYPVEFGSPLFEKMFQTEGPFEIVANFAAHKHVRSEKDPYAIEAMLENNVFKARHLLDLLDANKPERFFCVSTDKAANPVSVMGASKQLMEQLILSYSHKFPVTTARFANVAFSNGSLLAGFLERLAKRQPLSAPLDVGRYFVSAEEAGQLCLLACMLGDSGDIFFPKLIQHQDVRSFSEIGTALLNTLGFEAELCATEQEAREKAAFLKPDSKSWPVYYFASETSGEKALEEFFTATETLDVEQFSSIGIVKNAQKSSEEQTDLLSLSLDALKAVFAKEALTKEEIVQVLSLLVPDFQHLETGKSLDQKM